VLLIQADENAGQTMSSVETAELCGKRHDHVMRDIRSTLEEAGIGLLKFEQSYLNAQNKTELSQFVEGEDFGINHKPVVNSGRGRPPIDYAVTIDCAKNIAMMEQTEQGRQEIAELCGKRHRDVMRDIRVTLGEAGISLLKFEQSYLNSRNQAQPCFYLPKLECDLVVSGYSVKYRLAIIKRWHELEEVATATPGTRRVATSRCSSTEWGPQGQNRMRPLNVCALRE